MKKTGLLISLLLLHKRLQLTYTSTANARARGEQLREGGKQTTAHHELTGTATAR
jgi:hypothetical protein